MKIAIDLNDVIRDYTANYIKYYKQGINPEFDEQDVDFTTNDMETLLRFSNPEEWKRFTYEDYAFEIYGRCPLVESNIVPLLNRWIDEDLSDEGIEVMIVSPMEYGLTIQGSYFFISKVGIRAREMYFPVDSSTIWDRCDAVITANPRIMATKPEGKTLVKINRPYNVGNECTVSFDNLSDAIKDKNIISTLKRENQ